MPLVTELVFIMEREMDCTDLAPRKTAKYDKAAFREKIRIK